MSGVEVVSLGIGAGQFAVLVGVFYRLGNLSARVAHMEGKAA